MCDDHGRVGGRVGGRGLWVGGVVACASIKSSTHSASDADRIACHMCTLPVGHKSRGDY